MNIQQFADSIIGGKTISGSTSLGLSYLVSDVIVEEGIVPNLFSRYGTSLNCNDGN